ncbi:MAG: C45 family peptidase [Nitrososphaeria archaeon]|nr:C45 family peptidase [Nitrososphaeria archaeon]
MIEKIKVFGDHYEMGLEYGRILKQRIKKMMENLADMGMIKAMRPKIVPKKWFLNTLKKDTEKLMKNDILKYYPRQWESLKGIADGAGIENSMIILMISLEASGFSLGGCTSLGLPSQMTVEGEPVLARNFDFPIEFTEYQVVIESRPKDGYGSLGCSIIPSHGILDGLNEYGLAVACNFAYSLDKPTCIVPLSITLQEMLENCRSVDEAIDFLKACKRGGYGAIITIMDTNANIKVIELSSHNYSVREDGTTIVTNHYITEKMQKIEIPKQAIYSKKAPKELWGKRVHESSEKRYIRVEQLLKTYNKVQENDIIRILKDHGEEDQPSDSTICRHTPYHNTIRSTIIYPKKRILKATFGNPCKTEYQQFSF